MLAVMVMGYDAADVEAGVPLRVAVPLPLSMNITPVGRLPDSVKEATGNPAVVTENHPVDPVVNVVVLPEVMASPWSMVRVKLWVALVPMPLAAVRESV